MGAPCARIAFCICLAGLVKPTFGVASQPASTGSQSVSPPLGNWPQREWPVPHLGENFSEFARRSDLQFLGRVRPERVYRGVLLGRVWASAEYLTWATKGHEVPPLLSTGPTTTPPTAAGVVGAPGTLVLAGRESLYDDFRSGGRGTIGYWFTPFQISGLEASYFAIDGRDAFYSVDSTERAIIARPYAQLPDSTEQSLLVAYPGLLESQTDVRSNLDLTGAEMLLRQVVVWVPGFRLDLLAGYRHGYLSDRLAGAFGQRCWTCVIGQLTSI